MRAGLRFYQVQAQLTATRDGWNSSRQARTMIVGASEPSGAAQAVSHLAWDCSTGGYTDKATIATVSEVINGDNGDIIPTGPMTWVGVVYSQGTIFTYAADTYQQLNECMGR